MCKKAVDISAKMVTIQIEDEESVSELCADLQVLMNKLHEAPEKGTDGGVTPKRPNDRLAGSTFVRSRTSRRRLARLFEVKRIAKTVTNLNEMRRGTRLLAESLVGRKLGVQDTPENLAM